MLKVGDLSNSGVAGFRCSESVAIIEILGGVC